MFDIPIIFIYNKVEVLESVFKSPRLLFSISKNLINQQGVVNVLVIYRYYHKDCNRKGKTFCRCNFNIASIEGFYFIEILKKEKGNKL